MYLNESRGFVLCYEMYTIIISVTVVFVFLDDHLCYVVTIILYLDVLQMYSCDSLHLLLKKGHNK